MRIFYAIVLVPLKWALSDYEIIGDNVFCDKAQQKW